jgi:hypothetical protein
MVYASLDEKSKKEKPERKTKEKETEDAFGDPEDSVLHRFRRQFNPAL